MKANSHWALLGLALLIVPAIAFADPTTAQTQPATQAAGKVVSEDVLGVVPVVDDGKNGVHIIKLAVLPSLEPDLEDVIVRSVVRRDLDLTGMFDLIDDSKAPQGMYGFDDPIDLNAWQNLGAEVIVKVSARATDKGRVKVLGLCYFLNVGKEPVYKKSIVVEKGDVRVTAHRITDALLGAITGRNGGFASHLAFASKSGRNYMVFTLDADGNNMGAVSDPAQTAMAPEWGLGGDLFYAQSTDYSPFFVLNHRTKARLPLPYKTSVYSLAFNRDKTRIAVAVAEASKSAIYIGNADGSAMARVSTTELATHPAFSPSGKLSWVGGNEQGSQRIFIDGKPVSPAAFPASAPTFCDTEDGVFLVYSVGVGGDRHDLVMSNERGGNMTRLTQGQGSNTYPACSPDGRMLAYFSARKNEGGLYIKSLKSWKDQKVSSRIGESLRWAALP